jgi:hypothetical protein
MQKSPRGYAFAYLDAVGLEQQTQALQGCPPDWQAQVKLHIRLLKQRPPVPAKKKRAA